MTSAPCTLANGDDRLVIGQDGRIRELVCRGTALAHPDAGAAWRLFYRRGWLTQAEAVAAGEPRILADGDGLALVWDGLVGPDGPVDVRLELRVGLAGGALTCSATLANRDRDVVLCELQAPLVHDRGLLRRQLITSRLGGQRHGDFAAHVIAASRFRSAPYCDADHEGIQVQLAYPGIDAAVNCLISDGGDHGLYLGCHDPAFHTTVQVLRLDGPGRDRPLLGFARHLAMSAGGSEAFGPFCIAPYRGTWHVAADRYRAWVDTWWRRRPVPAWVRRSHGWQRLILRHQNGQILFRYDDLPRIHADGARAGLDTLFMFGWWPGGMDRMYPHYEPDAELGGEQALREGVERFQRQLGGHVICYASGRLADRAAPWYRQHGPALAVKRRSGIEVGDAYLFSNAATYDRLHGSTELTPICQACRPWAGLLHGLVDRAADLGCRAVFFDQLGTLEHPCHDPAHGHAVPYLHQAADKRVLLDALQAHSRARHPDMALGIEIPSDCTAQYADFVHGVYLQSDIAREDYRASGRRPATTGFIELWRYLFPEVAISDRDIRDDEDLLRRANLVVLRGLLSDAEIHRCRATIAACPAYQEHLGRLNALRDRLSAWLVDGDYRDATGFDLDGDAEARLFRAGDGSVAVVATQSHLERSMVRIRVPGRRCTAVDGVGAWSTDPGGGLELGRDALAVLVFR